MKESKKPEIRFNGFDDDWEQVELKDIVDVRSGCDYKHLSKGEIPVYGTGGYMLSVDKALSYDENAIGIGRKGTINKPYILKAPFWTVDTLFYCLPRLNIDLEFAFCLFQKIDWKKKDESTGVPSLSKQIINFLDIFISKFSEQTQIGEFFKNIDKRITLQQNKYDKLIHVKKSMLEKMFPKNGDKKPEVRFKGFADDWEQCNLDKLADFSKGYGYSKSDLKGSGIPIILYGRLYTKYQAVISDVDTFVDEKSNSIFSRGGEVIVPASGETAEDISRASVVEKSGIILGGDLNIVKLYEPIEPIFLVLSISNDRVHKTLSKFAQGKSVVHLHNSDLQKVELIYPQKKVEQTKIGDLFKCLNKLIILHQQKLKKLKNIKKSCLEKMFV